MSNIKSILESSNKIAIFWHENIDWDCIWSMLWLWTLLEKQWKKVWYFTPSEPSKIFKFLPDVKKIKTNFDYWKYDLLIFTDFTWYGRISKFTENKHKYFDENNLIIIDHHPENSTPKHAILKKDIHSISACEIVFETTYKRRKKYYDKDIATYLYLGLTTDSGNFRFDQWEQTPRILKNALKLVNLWADKKSIVENIFRTKTFQSIKFMQKVLDRMVQDWNIVYSYYQDSELSKYKLDEEEAVYWQFIMQDIMGPDIVVLFKKIWKFIKWSIRSKKADVSKIAQTFWWWWHRNASGFKVDFKWNFNKEIKEIITKIKAQNNH
jgi:phosphoesterase RecJ-like protein